MTARPPLPPGMIWIGDAAAEVIPRLLARLKEPPIRTRWAGVDAALEGGFRPGLYLLTGAPGTGKTQWAIQCATAAARAFAAAGQGDRVRYLALVESESEVGARVMAELSDERWSDLLYGSAGIERLTAARDRSEAELRALPFEVETPTWSRWSYRDLARVGDELRPPKLLVVDFVSAPEARVAHDLARRCGIVVLAIVAPFDEACELPANARLELVHEPHASRAGQARRVWVELGDEPKDRVPLWWDGCRFSETRIES